MRLPKLIAWVIIYYCLSVGNNVGATLPAGHQEVHLDTRTVPYGALTIEYQGSADPLAHAVGVNIQKGGRLRIIDRSTGAQSAIQVSCHAQPPSTHRSLWRADVRVSSCHDRTWPGLAIAREGRDIQRIIHDIAAKIKDTAGCPDDIDDNVLAVLARPSSRTGAGTSILLVDPSDGQLSLWYESETNLCCPEWVTGPEGSALVASQHARTCVRLVALRPGGQLLKFLQLPGTCTGMASLQGWQDFWYCRSGTIWHAHPRVVPGGKGLLHAPCKLPEGTYDRPQPLPDGSLLACKDGAIVHIQGPALTVLVPGKQCTGLAWSEPAQAAVYSALHQGSHALFMIEGSMKERGMGKPQRISGDHGGEWLDPKWSPRGWNIAAVHKKGGLTRIGLLDRVSLATWFIELPGYTIEGVCWVPRGALLDKIRS